MQTFPDGQAGGLARAGAAAPSTVPRVTAAIAATFMVRACINIIRIPFLFNAVTVVRGRPGAKGGVAGAPASFLTRDNGSAPLSLLGMRQVCEGRLYSGATIGYAPGQSSANRPLPGLLHYRQGVKPGRPLKAPGAGAGFAEGVPGLRDSRPSAAGTGWVFTRSVRAVAPGGLVATVST